MWQSIVLLTFTIVLLLLMMRTIASPSSLIDRYSIGGGSPGMFIRYAIRGDSCGCGVFPDGRPMCDFTGPISYT